MGRTVIEFFEYLVISSVYLYFRTNMIITMNSLVRKNTFFEYDNRNHLFKFSVVYIAGDYAYIMWDRNMDFMGKNARYITQEIQGTG